MSRPAEIDKYNQYVYVL